MKHYRRHTWLPWVFTTSLFLVLHAHSIALSTVIISRHSLCLMHTGKPAGMAVPLRNLVSDSTNLNCVLDPPPRSFVGSL